MSDEEKQEEERLETRFPEAPRLPDVPDAPQLAPLPKPKPLHPSGGAAGPGAYGKTALAYSAVSSIIMPFLVLTVGGYLLDNHFHTAPKMVLIGFVLGLLVSATSLLRIIKRLE